MDIADSPYDFSRMHEGIQAFIDNGQIAGANAVVLKDDKVVDYTAWGFADVATEGPIEPDTIFRLFSNTKIVTSVAVMCLLEDGCFDLDDPVGKYLPQLANRQVLRADAANLDDTEAASAPPTIRQLTCHNAGFSYGFLQQSLVDASYNKRLVQDPGSTLTDMIDKLADLPLAYQPGSRWQYSVSTDILARLVEVWSGQTFGEFLSARIFGPLGMRDTGFYVPVEKHDRLASNYAPDNPLDPDSRLHHVPEGPGGYLKPRALESGGGGLTGTITDYLAFIRMLVNEGATDRGRILKTESIQTMRTSQLPAGVAVELPNWVMPDTLFGIGLAIKTVPQPGETAAAIGEYHWGGMAGTHSWVAPDAKLAGLIFTQRLPGFWHPFSHTFKRLTYQAIENGQP
jgi:CubicO group peptidase (beta-lactamase class C family)